MVAGCVGPLPAQLHCPQRTPHLPTPPNPTSAAANLAGVPVAAVGKQYDLTYPVEQLGEGADALDKLLKG